MVDEADRERRLSLARSLQECGALPSVIYLGLAYRIVRLLYFFVGLLVWVRR